MRHWLFKTEPSTYSYARLERERKTNWNGIRNFQARNFLREISKGDLALIYHSGDDKMVVGVAKIISEPYAEVDKNAPGDWVQVDVSPVETLPMPVPLADIKKTPAFAELLLVRHSRLSVMPVPALLFQKLRKMGGAK